MKLQTTIKFGFLAASLFALHQGNAQQKPGLRLDLMDKTIRPQDDFFKFVNGTWLKNTEIPADKTRWGSFDELRQNTDKDALAILNAASKDPKYKSTTDQGKAINMYKSAMDTVARNKQGILPLKPYLAKIDAVKNIQDLQKLMMEEEAHGGGVGFFGFGLLVPLVPLRPSHSSTSTGGKHGFQRLRRPQPSRVWRASALGLSLRFRRRC